MFKRPSPSLIVFGSLLALVIVWLLDLIASTVVGDFITRHLAAIFGIDGAKMIATASEFLLPVIIAAFLTYGAYLVGVQDREKNKPSGLQILFDSREKKYVCPIKHSDGERYSVELKNINTDTTLYDVTLRAKAGKFVQRTIAIAWQRVGKLPQIEPIIFEQREFHPNVSEEIFLFGWSPQDCTDPKEREFFSRVHRFTLEARARDTKTVTAEFEFNMQVRPMLKRIS